MDKEGIALAPHRRGLMCLDCKAHKVCLSVKRDKDKYHGVPLRLASSLAVFLGGGYF